MVNLIVVTGSQYVDVILVVYSVYVFTHAIITNTYNSVFISIIVHSSANFRWIP